MKLAIELIPNISTPFATHHRYEMVVTRGDAVFEDTRGKDAFSFNGMILSGAPITGTGRAAVHHQEPDLREHQGTPSEIADIAPEEFNELALWLDTNAILAQETLQTFYSLRVRANGRETLIPLLLLRVHWEGQGLFKIYLDGLEGMLKAEAV